MRPYINILGGALFIIWIIEYFGYKRGENIHILLLLSIILFLVGKFVIFPSKDGVE